MNKVKTVAFVIIKYLSLVIASLVAFIPIFVVFTSAFKEKTEYDNTSPLALPKSFLYFKNFKAAFLDGHMIGGFINTGIVLAFSIVGAVIIGTMVAYVIDRFAFKGRNLILLCFLFASMIPTITTQVAVFKIINFLHLFNNRGAAILLYLGTDVLAIYIFLQFMSSIPVSLDESAMLDGASYLTIYFRIILPLLKPAIATVFIIKGVSIYNDFYIPFLYMPKKELHVVSTALYNFLGPSGDHWEIVCALIIIAIIPTLIAFLSLQKYLYNGLTQGSVKM